MLLRLGKYKAQEIVLLMLCETQGARLAAVVNRSKLFEMEKDNFYVILSCIYHCNCLTSS